MTRYIEYVDVSTLQPDPANAKMHDQDALEESIKRFGYVEPVVIDERTGLLVAGHGRVEQLQAQLAKDDGHEEIPSGVRSIVSGTWQIPVVRGWASTDDDEAHAYAIASNRLTERGGWDDKALYELLKTAAEDPDELIGTGFYLKDLDELAKRIQTEDIAYGKDTAHADPGYADKQDNYRNNQVRSLLFDYPVEDYAFVTATVERARVHYRVEGNAELFTAMVAEYGEPDEDDRAGSEGS